MMATRRPTPPADLAGGQPSDARVDHALALLLADQPEPALQWAAAVVEREPAQASALVVTSRLLEQLGRTRAAIEGLLRAVDRAIDAGNLPLAIAAVGDLRALGVDVRDPIDRVASSFCRGSSRLREEQPSAVLQVADFQPLSPFLTGPALASKATQILHAASEADDPSGAPGEPSLIAPVPLFSALSKEALRELLSAFDTITVPAGHTVVREGEGGAAAYIVASGELEVSRGANEGRPPIALARLGPGAFLGEMELLSEMQRTAKVVATRPSILLVAKREALDAVAARRPDVATELTAHCRRRIVEGLGRGSALLTEIPSSARAELLDRFETRLFRKGDKLIREGEDAQGLHLIVSGEVVVVAHEAGEPVLLATLATGETVGEVELILCRTANADAIAAHPTSTLFLPRWAFFALVQEHPALLPGMYMAAVRRHAEAKLALEAACVVVTDGYFLDEATGVGTTVVNPPRRERPSRFPGEDAAAARMAAQIGRAERSGDPRSGGTPAESVPAGASAGPSSSISPTSASVRPSAMPSPGGRWTTGPVFAIAGGAGLAAAAVAIFMAGAQGRLLGPMGATGQAAGAAAAPAVPAAPAPVWASHSSQDDRPAASSVAEKPSPEAGAAVAPASPPTSAPKNVSRSPAPWGVRAAGGVRPPNPRPAAAAPTAVASAGPSSASPPLGPPAPAIGATKPSSLDDFGGRN
jgi:CRP-like cAMP-binding protein